MRLPVKYFLFFFLAAVFVSCDKNDDATTAPTLDAYLKAESTLSTFSRALDKAGLESFKTGPGPFTWFAPTNDAFTSAGITEDSLSKMTQGQISYILLYHLANASLSSREMIALNSSPRNSQLGAGSNAFYIASVNSENYFNGTKISSRDNKVSNGYVHVINRLSTPPLLRGNLQNILTSTGQHSLFIQAITKANLWTQFGSASVFTIFAPTDAAMTAAGYTSTSIAAASGTTLTALTTAMRYHYLSSLRLFTNDLMRTSLPATAAGSNQYLIPSDNGTKIKGKGNTTPANIIKADNLATNGVVHIIDAVLRQ
jgi:uncharacterized surface protein with fasciclin (FAS1) repeats